MSAQKKIAALETERDQLYAELRRLQGHNAQPAEAEGVRDYLAEFADGEIEARTAIEELQAALSALTAERDAARRECDENEGAMQVWRRRTAQAEAERDQLRAEVEALRKAPAGWAKMDPAFVVEHIRETTVFDADMIEAMLEFAIGAAMAAKEA